MNADQHQYQQAKTACPPDQERLGCAENGFSFFSFSFSMQNWKRFTELKIKFYIKKYEIHWTSKAKIIHVQCTQGAKNITIEYVTKWKNEKKKGEKKKERMKNLYRKEFKVSMIFVC